MRVAVYFSPAQETSLWRAGSAWLGRDAMDDRVFPPLAAGRLGAHEAEALVASPRRYGFHGTLKAPFHIRAPYKFSDVVEELHEFARRQPPFNVRLRLGDMSNFVSLLPDGHHAALRHFSDAVLMAFDRFCAPLDAADYARRSKAGLSLREQELMGRWGYPYVFDHFRFHMTLTKRLDPAQLEHVMPIAADAFLPLLRQPIAIDRIALFIERVPGANFLIHTSLPLTGRAEDDIDTGAHTASSLMGAPL